ncbi:hypothetical protein NQ317_003463 [Molorchus minor]|uniref:Multidrug resistance-associated protein lethal(2)03659 n=1 Tax=Molorchus minor TaxID=1323400 RepID=A0ABQ9K2E9_9CUCU|nr:hypothetical protein NQ317_003463 [Molorchus minor]
MVEVLIFLLYDNYAVFECKNSLTGSSRLEATLYNRLSQPLLITQFLKYYESGQSEVTEEEAKMYGALIVVDTLFIVLCSHHYILRAMHLGMKIRVAICSLIYRKALKLNKSALAETTIGQMVNLLSNDVGRFNQAVSHIHYLWLAPIELIIVSYLLYVYVGPIGLVGAVFLLLFTPLQTCNPAMPTQVPLKPCFSVYRKKTSQYRLRTAIRTDERVRLMSEIINGIQVIKMYTWEKPFAELVNMVRRKEMQQIGATSVIRAIVMSFTIILNRIAIYLCILTYILTGHTLTATFAYTVSSFYNNLREVMTKAFPKAVTHMAETNVSIKRIQKFLLYDEVDKNDLQKELQNDVNGKDGSAIENYKKSEIGIHLQNASIKWVNTTENILDYVSVSATTNELIAIVGPVGSGKTTLLHVILRELSPLTGSVKVKGSLSYCSQDPWLFGGTVRQNIIFGQPFVPKKYKEVINVCALERDFALLPHEDLTRIGDRGVTLSGGQRARINLARAIYKDADIYLLDDPLSAVDTHVGKQIFDECICGYLKTKCVVLVTHQLQYLSQVERIYLLENGKIEASGTYSDLQSSNSEFTKLLINHSEDNEETENVEVKKKTKKEEKDQNAPTQSREERGTGAISRNVYSSYFNAGGNCFKISLIAFGFIISQIAASSIDYFISIWVNLQQARLQNNVSFNPLQDFLNKFMTENIGILIYSIILLVTVISTLIRSIYFFRYCMEASKKLHNVMLNKILYTSMRFFNMNPPGRILNRFSKDIGIVDEMLPLTILDTIQVALIVVFISLVNGSLYPWIFLPTLIILVIFYFLRVVFLATSRNIKRVEAVTRSPIYTHLSASLHGLTTIRAFGAEEVLKREFDNYQNLNSAPCYLFIAANRTFGFWLDFHCVVYVACVIISILCISRETFGGNVGLALTQSLTLTGQFQWGMRQWSELENNMTSIERVQEYTEVVPEKDEKKIDPPKSWPEHGGIKFERVFLKYSLDDPYVLQNLNFEVKPKEKVGIVGRTGAGKSSLIAAIFRLADIEGNIYIDKISTKDLLLATLRSKVSIIPQEPVLFSGTLRKNLDPFDQYSDDIKQRKYLTSRNKVILTWVPGHSGVRGNEEADRLAREGSAMHPIGPELILGVPYSMGVSAMKELLSMNRRDIRMLTGLLTGHCHLSRHLQLIGIAEDPECRWCLKDEETSSHLLTECPATARVTERHFGSSVLNPEDFKSIQPRKLCTFAKEVLWNALEEVELKAAVVDLPAGLENEATANVDPHTDALIQKTIRRKFAECTVLTIAHRLNTVMDSDKVLVMDAGKAVEFDHPYKLLQNLDGVFYRLVLQTGKTMMETLTAIAKENYYQNKSL